MNDMIDFIAELKELQSLYNTGDLRNFDFERMIQKYEREADAYDSAMDQWFRETYSPVGEV
jgi:hypothetical protein